MTPNESKRTSVKLKYAGTVKHMMEAKEVASVGCKYL